MKRVTGIIVAGMLTGTVLVTVLALGIRNVVRADNTSTPVSGQPVVVEQVIPATNSEPATGSRADQQAQMDQLLQTMAQREAAYQQQLEAANQTIQQLQTQQQAQQQAQPRFGSGEHEEFEGFDD